MALPAPCATRAMRWRWPPSNRPMRPRCARRWPIWGRGRAISGMTCGMWPGCRRCWIRSRRALVRSPRWSRTPGCPRGCGAICLTLPPTVSTSCWGSTCAAGSFWRRRWRLGCWGTPQTPTAQGNRVKANPRPVLQRLLKTGTRPPVVGAERARLGGGRARPRRCATGEKIKKPPAQGINRNRGVFTRLPCPTARSSSSPRSAPKWPPPRARNTASRRPGRG